MNAVYVVWSVLAVVAVGGGLICYYRHRPVFPPLDPGDVLFEVLSASSDGASNGLSVVVTPTNIRIRHWLPDLFNFLRLDNYIARSRLLSFKEVGGAFRRRGVMTRWKGKRGFPR